MHLRRAGLVLAAASLFAGEPWPRPKSTQIECSCPIQVRGGGALKYESSGRVRMYTRNGVQRIVVEGKADSLSVTLPGGPGLVDVRSRDGDIDVRQLKSSVQVQTVGGKVYLDGIDGNASAKTGGGEVRVGRVRGNLKVMSGGNGISVGQVDGEAWCETTGGEIIVEHAGGQVHATTGGGNIYVADAAAGVMARSDGGLIDVQRCGGDVEAITRGGSIQVGSAKGAICESAAGGIRLRNIAGTLRAQTAMGSILAEITGGSPREESSLTTGAGDITVMIPSNLAISVQAISESRGRLARIVSDFTEIRIMGAQAWPLRSIAAQGALNGGGPTLHVTAGGGTVYLRRQR